MIWNEFRQLVMPLAVQLGAEWDAPTWKLYHRAVEKIPTALFVVALQDAAETRTTFPSAAQLRELAEQRRQALLTAHAYDGCCECADHRGFRAILVEAIEWMERCPCFRRHQEKIASLGVTAQPLALPAVEPLQVRSWMSE